MKYLASIMMIVVAAFALGCESDGGSSAGQDATNSDTVTTDGTDGTDAADGTTGAEGTDSTDATDGGEGTDATDATDETDGGDATDGANIEAGQMIYQNNCSGCHGPTGAGGVGPSLMEEVPGLSDEELEQVITQGRNTMPPFGFFTDEQLTNLVGWLRATFE